jgi:hypothetical protein
MTFTPSPESAAIDVNDGRTFCAVHTDIETTLRCNKCGRYMCSKCVVRTPVGYRCKQCVHQQQDVFYTAVQRDYIVAAVVSLVLSVPAAYILMRLGLFLIIFLAIPAGGLIGEAVHRAIGRRRGRHIWIAAGVAITLGAVIAILLTIVPLMSGMNARLEGVDPEVAARASRQMASSMLGPLFVSQLIPGGLYTVLCAGAAIARLRYGK